VSIFIIYHNHVFQISICNIFFHHNIFIFVCFPSSAAGLLSINFFVIFLNCYFLKNIDHTIMFNINSIFLTYLTNCMLLQWLAKSNFSICVLALGRRRNIWVFFRTWALEKWFIFSEANIFICQFLLSHCLLSLCINATTLFWTYLIYYMFVF